MKNRLATASTTIVQTQAELRTAMEFGGWVVQTSGKELRSYHTVHGMRCLLVATIDRRLVTFVLQPDWAIPRAQRPAAALEVSRVNARTAFGCLSLAPENGTVCSRVASPLSDHGIACQTVFDLIITAAALLHQHWQSILHPHPLPSNASNASSFFSRMRLTASDPPMSAHPDPSEDAWESIDLIRYRERWRNCAVLRDATSQKILGILSFDDSVNASAAKRAVFRDLSGERESLHRLLDRNQHPDLRAYYDRCSESDPLRAALNSAGLTQQYEEFVVCTRLDTALSLLGKTDTDEVIWQQGFQLSGKLLDKFLESSPNRGLHMPVEREAIRTAINQAQVATIGSPPRAFVAVAHDQGSGTILLLAVLPKARRQGLGRQLHAAALMYLHAKGVKDYFDMTDTHNIPMQRLFFRHGAQLLGSIVVRHPPQAGLCRLA